MTGLMGACAEYTINQTRRCRASQAGVVEKLTLKKKLTGKREEGQQGVYVRRHSKQLQHCLPLYALSYDRQHLRTVRWHGYHQLL